MPKILLVEDDTNLREIFEMRLKAEGYQTVTAGNGEEALVVAMKEKPDLIIADVMMPKLSGFEMLETLRATPEMADTKAIMMTALGQPEDRARGEALGVLKYLVKSQVTLEDFVRVVREVISPDSGATGAGSQNSDEASANSQLQTNQERERSMQPDSTNQGSDSQQTNKDTSGNGGMQNPINDNGMGGQQTTAQEQGQVNSQIDNAMGGDAAGAAGQSGGSDSTMGGGPTTAPAGDSSAGGGSDAMGGGTQTDIPVSTPPAEQAPQPPTESSDQSGQSSGSSS